MGSGGSRLRDGLSDLECDAAMSEGFTEDWLRSYNNKRQSVKSDSRIEKSSDDSRSFRPRKYRNEPVEFQGEKFDSKKEATVYQQLRIRQTIGEIRDLKRQVPCLLFACQRATQILIVVAKYIADFEYYEDDLRVLVDVKSEITRKNQTYVLKKHWLEAQDGIKITEV